MTPITAVIITHNEEDRIAETLCSLVYCDEILVIDAASSDRTREIAAHCGARVMTAEWRGFSQQKNFGAEHASHDWILSIDADERPSIELANEIMDWKRSTPDAAAWSMPRRASYFGGWIAHSGWYPDRKIRLFNRHSAQWREEAVHESLEVRGTVKSFNGDLLHFPYRSWSDQLQRVDRYTRIASDAAKASGRRGNPLMLVLAPPISFFRCFVLRLGFLDGWRGAVIAYSAARYVFIRHFRILRGRWS